MSDFSVFQENCLICSGPYPKIVSRAWIPNGPSRAQTKTFEALRAISDISLSMWRAQPANIYVCMYISKKGSMCVCVCEVYVCHKQANVIVCRGKRKKGKKEK